VLSLESICKKVSEDIILIHRGCVHDIKQRFARDPVQIEYAERGKLVTSYSGVITVTESYQLLILGIVNGYIQSAGSN
jgi:hypothetical protein